MPCLICTAASIENTSTAIAQTRGQTRVALSAADAVGARSIAGCELNALTGVRLPVWQIAGGCAVRHGEVSGSRSHNKWNDTLCEKRKADIFPSFADHIPSRPHYIGALSSTSRLPSQSSRGCDSIASWLQAEQPIGLDLDLQIASKDVSSVFCS